VDVLMRQPQNTTAVNQQSFLFVISGMEQMQGIRVSHGATFFNPEEH